MDTGDGSRVIAREPCPKCGSRDNLARYDDGHAYCFGYGCGYFEKGDGMERPEVVKDGRMYRSNPDLIPLSELTYEALPKRGLQEETCRHWKYGTIRYNGKPCQVATYFDPQTGSPVCQKLRFADKSFKLIGDTSNIPLYGQWLCRDNGKMIIVTEGEIDAASVSQAQSLKWPAVSVPNGAQSAARHVRENIEFLENFERVVFMFDMDDAGQDAARECAEILSPGKAFVANLPLKDPNEMLKDGRGHGIINAAWGAKEFRPDGIIGVDSLLEEARKPIEWGYPWFLPSLTDATFGRRETEVYAIGAGTGIGKTDFLTQQIQYDVDTLGMPVGVLFLEQKPVETAKRVAGKRAGRRFHVPDSNWKQEELDDALEALKGKVFFYDSFGQTEWDSVKAKIRYMAVAYGVKLFYVDHLTAMADTGNERESLEQIMKEMAGLANELSIIIHFVSHLATPEGRPHEEGGRVQIRHFKGSRSIGFWSYFMIGLERNQQAEEEADRQTTILRILKDRYTGQSTGLTVPLGYDHETGLMYEAENPFTDQEDIEDGEEDF